LIRLQHVYLLTGLFLAYASLGALRRLRWAAALFWGLLAVAFLVGDRLQPALLGALVLVLALLAPLGLGSSEPRAPEPKRLGASLLAPALLIPAFTLAGVLGLRPLHWAGRPLLEPANATLVALGLACAGALAAALAITRRGPGEAATEGSRLLDAIGWAALLPLLLATLGSVFSACGVGEAVAHLVRAAVPMDSRLVAVLAYGLGMALLTMIMGNAFAAFPVMTAGVGLPLLVRMHGAHPAVLGALGMLSGYCGTLLTPMAANYNIVPAALLELPDANAVIKAQAPTALALLSVNLGLMYFLVF
jgi:uncharacterized membrane protein